jgi:hypothetical protein
MATYVVSDKRHIWGVICSLIASTTIEGFPILTSVNLQDLRPKKKIKKGTTINRIQSHKILKKKNPDDLFFPYF